MTVPDFAAQLRQVTQLFNGGDPTDRDFLVAAGPGSAFLYGSVAPVLMPELFEHHSGLLIPNGAAVPPQPIDQVITYLTAPEVLGQSISVQQVRLHLQRVSLRHTVEFASHWLTALNKPSVTRSEVDEQFIVTYLNEPHATRVRNVLRTPGRGFLTPQSLMILTKLAFECCEVRQRDVGETDEHILWALFGIQQNMNPTPEGFDPEADMPVGEIPGWLGRGMIANQFFNTGLTEQGVWAMFQRCWRELPEELAGHERVVNLADVYKEATGVDLSDFELVSCALWAATALGQATVTYAWFDNLGLGHDRLEPVLELIAATPDELAGPLAAEAVEFGVEWSVRTFQRFPVVRWSDALTVVHPKLLLARSTGMWPLFDIRREHPDRNRVHAAERCVTHVSEEYALEALSGIVGTASRIYREDALRKAYGRNGKVCDAAIDYGHSWVVAEVTTTALAAGTTAGTSDPHVSRDVGGYVRKARQLHVTIENLRADEARLTGATFGGPRRFFPVLVLASQAACSPVFMELLRQRLRAEELLQTPDVAQLEVMEVADLDVVEGHREHGGPDFASLLRDKSQSSMRDMPMRDYISIGLNAAAWLPKRVEERWDGWVRSAMDALRENQPSERAAARDDESTQGQIASSRFF